MRGARHYLDGLVQLHLIDDGEERRAVWRQSLATLAAAVSHQRRAVPLEGLDPHALEASTRAALDARFVDDLGFLNGPAAAAALYELAAALPAGDSKRDLGRRVLTRLKQGSAPTFVALATQLALGSKRALAGAGNRARVALALDLPIGTGTRADALALALISRRELSREWLTIPSQGSLPSRRLAARLLERAAREAAQRAAEGDDSGVRVFRTEAVRAAWARLLGDRESLVWRHVATARGLLSLSVPRMDSEIHDHLDPKQTITEWRRAAASIGASIAVRPQSGLRACRNLLESDVYAQDRGVAGAMIFGLPRAAEAEPEVVEELLEQLVRCGGLDAAEALVDLRRERIGDELGSWAAQHARAQLREALTKQSGADDGRVALMQGVADELTPADERRGVTLREMLADALDAFVEHGPAAAGASATAVLHTAKARMELLVRTSDDERMGRLHAFRALRELDRALLETDTLGNLLALGPSIDGQSPVRELGDVFGQLTHWLVLHEGDPVVEAGAVPHFTMRLRRLRTMLHLVDADGGNVEDRPQLLRKRRLLTARVLYQRVQDDGKTPLRRALCAAAARAGDALVREDIAEVSDVLLAAATHGSQQDLVTMAEASMVPDIEAAVSAYAKLEAAVIAVPTSGRGVRVALDALVTLANDLPIASSPRVEALRSGLLDFARSLETIAASSSLSELAEHPNETPLAPFEAAVSQLAQLVAGARRRLGQLPDDEMAVSGSAIRLLDLCVERALRGSPGALGDAVATVNEALRGELPNAIAEVAALTLQRLVALPLDAPRRSYTSFMPAPPKEAPLPAWMPPNRTLGGFYVVRSIGMGAVGSVFVARRSDKRHATEVAEFALKVPDYTGAAARTLSEEQFLRLFQEEAGALLALPHHSNIATFVSFDAGARPKPILVMELVEGPTLERMLEMGDMDMSRAVELLDGIAAGLEAMHSVGVGHLDVKPSNVIMRDPDGMVGSDRPDKPVLVDFGLSGRHLRPGCGTAEYGSPEIWGLDASQDASRGTRPEPADIYAFGCLAYEVVTGRTLFDAPNEVAMITAHVSHDGLPPQVGVLTTDPRTAGLAEMLRRCLRRNPDQRVTMKDVRGALANLERVLSPLQWPLGAA